MGLRETVETVRLGTRRSSEFRPGSSALLVLRGRRGEMGMGIASRWIAEIHTGLWVVRSSERL